MKQGGHSHKGLDLDTTVTTKAPVSGGFRMRADDGTRTHGLLHGDEVIRRGIVPDISWSRVQRILAGLEVKPHKTEQWFHSPDPEFRPKVTAICDL